MQERIRALRIDFIGLLRFAVYVVCRPGFKKSFADTSRAPELVLLDQEQSSFGLHGSQNGTGVLPK